MSPKLQRFVRKCRGALGLGVFWAVVWAAIFAGLSIVIGIFDPDSIDPGEGPVRVAWIGSSYGFISGIAFSALLAMSEGRKTLSNLSPFKASVWGAIGTAAFPLLTERQYDPPCLPYRRSARRCNRGRSQAIGASRAAIA
jgi:hypothetical protein